MKAAKLLMEKVNRGEVVTGTLVMNQLWLGLVEMHIKAGLDYMIVDMEHGVHAPELVVEICALGRMIDFPILIRPIDLEMSTIRRVLDMGAVGMLLPTVQSATDLDKVRDAIYVPPRGQRRPGGRGNEWVTDFSHDGWRVQLEDDVIVLPQIETQLGLDNVADIASHEITTAMAHGPYDLSMDLGVGNQTNGPEVLEATKQIQAAANEVGKKMWVIGDGPTMKQRGYTFICIGLPTSILETSLQNIVLATVTAD
ncbi:MAG: aldolase/citrate lyase family protein [Chloroflexota bacterium]